MDILPYYPKVRGSEPRSDTSSSRPSFRPQGVASARVDSRWRRDWSSCFRNNNEVIKLHFYDITFNE